MNYSGGTPNVPNTADGDCYAAINLSSVAAVQNGDLSQIYVMYDNGVNYHYDPAIFGDGDSGTPYDFTIDVDCTALSQQTYPTSGWVTAQTVTDNTLRSRDFTISMSDPGGTACDGNYNWVKMDVSQDQPNGWQGWQGTLDIWNASAGNTRLVDDVRRFDHGERLRGPGSGLGQRVREADQRVEQLVLSGLRGRRVCGHDGHAVFELAVRLVAPVRAGRSG